MSHLVDFILKPQTKAWETLGISKSNEFRRALDPASVIGANVSQGKPLTLKSSVDPWGLTTKDIPVKPPGAPNQDTASNAYAQQADQLRRRRGIYANIIGSSTQSSSNAPVATKSALGT